MTIQLIVILATLATAIFLNRLKGMGDEESIPKFFGGLQELVVYIGSSIMYMGLAYTLKLPIWVICYSLVTGIGYAIWRQKGPDIAFGGGTEHFHKDYELPNTPFIAKIMKKFHGIDITKRSNYKNYDTRKRIGEIGGAYRGYLYLLPLALLMLPISVTSLVTSLLGLLFGKIHTWVGYKSRWGAEGMRSRAELVSGAVIVWTNCALPLIARAYLGF